MKVSLNIENDKELRLYVKDLIKGQVLSIIREDYTKLIQEELERKIKGTNSYTFDNLSKNGFREAISAILYKEFNLSTWNNSFIKPIVEEQVKKAIADKNWKDMVDTLAKEKVKSLIS